MAPKKVLLCATMDTKATQAFFLKEEIEGYGHEVKIIDVGMRRESPPGVAYTQREVAGQYFRNLQASSTRTDASAWCRSSDGSTGRGSWTPFSRWEGPGGPPWPAPPCTNCPSGCPRSW